MPHLGRVRARHFAHRPGSTCPLTAPETRSTSTPRSGSSRSAPTRSPGAAPSRSARAAPRCRRVDPARPRGGRRRRGGRGRGRAAPGGRARHSRAGAPALALEVIVTHAVDAEKERGARAPPACRPSRSTRASQWEQETRTAASTIRVRPHARVPALPGLRRRARARRRTRARAARSAEIAELEAYRARGLFGPRPGGRPLASPPPLAPVERRRARRRFRCPAVRRADRSRSASGSRGMPAREPRPGPSPGEATTGPGRARLVARRRSPRKTVTAPSRVASSGERLC